MNLKSAKLRAVLKLISQAMSCHAQTTTSPVRQRQDNCRKASKYFGRNIIIYRVVVWMSSDV